MDKRKNTEKYKIDEQSPRRSWLPLILMLFMLMFGLMIIFHIVIPQIIADMFRNRSDCGCLPRNA
jgi:hypothetical protein